MKIVFKAPKGLLDRVRVDLRRRHRFAHERVGFLSCRSADLDRRGILLLAEGYYPVADEHYVRNTRAPVTIGPAAIRHALQIALAQQLSIFHVHMHAHSGMPRLSAIDVTENGRLIPDFFNVASQVPHGAIVLSDDHALGQCWMSKTARPHTIDEIVVVGAPMRFSWSRLWTSVFPGSAS